MIVLTLRANYLPVYLKQLWRGSPPQPPLSHIHDPGKLKLAPAISFVK